MFTVLMPLFPRTSLSIDHDAVIDVTQELLKEMRERGKKVKFLAWSEREKIYWSREFAMGCTQTLNNK